MIYIKLLTKVSFVSLLVGLAFLHPSSVFAQSYSLGIYPPVTHVILDPGQGTTLEYKITNTGDPTIVSSTLVPFVPDDETGGLRLIDCKNSTLDLCKIPQWFKPLESTSSGALFLSSNQTTSYKLKLFVPSEVPAGDYPVSLLFTGEYPTSTTALVSQIKPSIGTNIIVTVAEHGELRRVGKVTTFSPLGGFHVHLGPINMILFDTFDSIPIILRVQNTGTSLLEPNGELILESPIFPRSTFAIYPQYILSNSIRMLFAGEKVKPQEHSSEWKIASQSYTLEFPRSFYLGSYKLQAKMSLAPKGSPLTVTTSFIALPFKLILLALIVLLGVLGYNKRDRILAKILAFHPQTPGLTRSPKKIPGK